MGGRENKMGERESKMGGRESKMGKFIEQKRIGK